MKNRKYLEWSASMPKLSLNLCCFRLLIIFLVAPGGGGGAMLARTGPRTIRSDIRQQLQQQKRSPSVTSSTCHTIKKKHIRNRWGAVEGYLDYSKVSEI